ncbi:hypothetical protein [Thauera sp. SDU_THAU2]|uniref:hypothetical protein n=1 Tax=Thauera sp. SDU_THAU2 TaxID=3136633 RepID=UPI00311DD24D
MRLLHHGRLRAASLHGRGADGRALFQVEFDRALSPSEDGHLVVNTDVAGDGASVNLFAVRVLPGE